MIDPLVMVQHLTDAFSFLQNQKKKTKGTHIKEIQVLQRYFKTLYNPCDIRRTIYDTTVSLKQKIIEKLPSFKILPCVEDRYNFALKFHFSKLP